MVQKIGASHEAGSWSEKPTIQTTAETIRSQLHLPLRDKIQAAIEHAQKGVKLFSGAGDQIAATCQTVRQIALQDVLYWLDEIPITIQHAGGTVTLTPDQGRQVLAGGELVVDALGVDVR